MAEIPPSSAGSVQPRITIVIPTLNRVLLLRRALESALAQTAPAEIIVSDNGSSDGTAAWIDSIRAQHPSVEFLHRPSTISAPAHGWSLISRVTTEWMVFLSDDDFLEPGFVEAIIAATEAVPQASFVYTGCKLHFGQVVTRAKVGPERESAASFLMGFMEGRRNICMCATAFRRADLKAIGPQPEDVLIGDMFYWSRILTPKANVACDPRTLSNYVMYRPEGDSETSRTNVSHWAHESRDLADRMAGAILSEESRPYTPEAVRRARDRYLALTVSNQFIWNALRGAPRAALRRAVPQLAKYVAGDIKAWVRLAAALLLPRPILRSGVLGYARWLARGEAG